MKAYAELEAARVRLGKLIDERCDRELAKPIKNYRHSLGQLYSARGKYGTPIKR